MRPFLAFIALLLLHGIGYSQNKPVIADGTSSVEVTLYSNLQDLRLQVLNQARQQAFIKAGFGEQVRSEAVSFNTGKGATDFAEKINSSSNGVWLKTLEENYSWKLTDGQLQLVCNVTGQLGKKEEKSDLIAEIRPCNSVSSCQATQIVNFGSAYYVYVRSNAKGNLLTFVLDHTEMNHDNDTVWMVLPRKRKPSPEITALPIDASKDYFLYDAAFSKSIGAYPFQLSTSPRTKNSSFERSTWYLIFSEKKMKPGAAVRKISDDAYSLQYGLTKKEFNDWIAQLSDNCVVKEIDLYSKK